MNNVLREIESEDLIIYTELIYSEITQIKCEEVFDMLVKKGHIKANFNDNKWECYSDIKHHGISFDLDSNAYNTHIGKEFGITEKTMGKMIRCYAIYCYGEYIYQTIAQLKVNVIRKFLQRYKDRGFKLKNEEVLAVKDFLAFIDTPDKQIEDISSNIRRIKGKCSSQRKLSHIINYLAIENEINYLYSMQIDDETFKKWFPIYFWVNITFILPLRATEMLLTPKNCIITEGDKIMLKIRRSSLKKGNRTVYYDVNKDYKECTYEIPDTEVVENIKKYIELTKDQNRRFLFEYDEFMLNEMLSLKSFNEMISKFMNERIIGNSKYDYAKYATGINEFEVVTAGDSRPLAMASLYFQKAGEDIARQLADHVNINTSSGYYTNISQTIMSSSIMQLQKRLNNGQQVSEENYNAGFKKVVNIDESICVSKRREMDAEDLTDCIKQDHLEDCMGCKFYRPSQQELDAFMNNQKKKADESSKRVIDFMNNTMSLKNRNTTIEEVFLEVQTDATRYRMGCNIKAEEKRKEWERIKSIQKTNF